MASKPRTAPAPAAPVGTADTFKIETGIALPAVTRAVGASASPYTPVMKKLALGATPDKLQSFFIPVTVPDSITNADEREKALKDEARKVSNRVSGLARRLADQTDSNNVKYAFAIRSRVENINGVDTHGVRVYRVAPKP